MRREIAHTTENNVAVANGVSGQVWTGPRKTLSDLHCGKGGGGCQQQQTQQLTRVRVCPQPISYAERLRRQPKPGATAPATVAPAPAPAVVAPSVPAVQVPASSPNTTAPPAVVPAPAPHKTQGEAPQPANPKGMVAGSDNEVARM